MCKANQGCRACVDVSKLCANVVVKKSDFEVNISNIIMNDIAHKVN